MSISVGSKVKFVATTGHPQELAVANQHLDASKEYTVNMIHAIPAVEGDTFAMIKFLFLDGVPAHGFKVGMFEAVV